jgi:hypothetical protein
MMMPRSRWIWAAPAALALVACSSSGGLKPTTQSVQTKTSNLGSAVAKNLNGAVDALNGMSAVTALENGLAPLQNALGTNVPVLSSAPSQVTSYLSSRRSVRSFARVSRSRALTTSAPGGDDTTLATYLKDRVFAAENVESSDASSITFLLKGSALCPYILPDGSSSLLFSTGGVLDAGCVADVDKLQLRAVAAEPSSDDLDLTLQVGPGKAAPLKLEVRSLSKLPSSIALVVSLDGVKGTLEFLKTLDDTTPVPLVLSGAVDVKVTFNRELLGKVDVTFSSSVRQAVDVKVQDTQGTTELTTAAKDPWARLQVDGIDQQLALAVDLGKTTVTTPYELYDGLNVTYPQESTTLGGLSFSLAAQEGQTGDFVISNIGLGGEQTVASLGGTTTQSLDLDPRQFALSFRADPASPSLTIFSVDPSFSLRQFIDDRPYLNTDPTTAGKTYTIAFTAAAGKPAFEPYDYCTGTYGTIDYSCGTALKVVNGTLTLTDAAGPSLTVAAGQCLLDAAAGVVTSKVQEHAAGACPAP